MVTSLGQAVQLVRSLKKRKIREATGCFLIEGLSFVAEALKSGVELECLVGTEEVFQRPRGRLIMEAAEPTGVPLFLVTAGALSRLAETENPQGILAVGRKPFWNLETILTMAEGTILLLDALQDPGNLGTILRTAEAVGVRAVCLGEGTVDLYNSKVLRATMGSVFRVPAFSRIRLGELLHRIKGLGFTVVAADPHTRQVYYRTDFRHPRLAVLIGNEGRGIAPGLLALCDERVKIPLKGLVESLNAAVATALILYEIQRQKEL